MEAAIYGLHSSFEAADDKASNIAVDSLSKNFSSSGYGHIGVEHDSYGDHKGGYEGGLSGSYI
jgi:hypothetical protein